MDKRTVMRYATLIALMFLSPFLLFGLSRIFNFDPTAKLVNGWIVVAICMAAAIIGRMMHIYRKKIKK